MKYAFVLLTAVGLWLMAAPAVLGYGGAPENSDRIAGPLLAAFSFLAIFQISRGVRWLNLPIGAWLVAAPFVLGAPADAFASSLVSGLLVLTLSPFGRPDQSRYGGGWRALRHTSELAGVSRDEVRMQQRREPAG